MYVCVFLFIYVCFYMHVLCFFFYFIVVIDDKKNKNKVVIDDKKNKNKRKSKLSIL